VGLCVFCSQKRLQGFHRNCRENLCFLVIHPSPPVFFQIFWTPLGFNLRRRNFMLGGFSVWEIHRSRSRLRENTHFWVIRLQPYFSTFYDLWISTYEAEISCLKPRDFSIRKNHWSKSWHQENSHFRAVLTLPLFFKNIKLKRFWCWTITALATSYFLKGLIASRINFYR